jgi:WhiB family redox-sensing transcriptional regulator
MTRATSLAGLAKPVGNLHRPPGVNLPLGRRPVPDFGSGLPCQDPDVDPDLFFPATVWLRGRGPGSTPTQAAQITLAKALCSGCPVVVQCGAWAIQHGELGIWGGLTEGERHRLQVRQRVATHRARRRSTT